MLALALILLAGDAPQPSYRLPVLPAAVSGFIERRRSCNHFGGEEPYDEERAQFLAETIADLRCDGLAGDEAALKARYASDPEVLEALEKTADWLPGEGYE